MKKIVSLIVLGFLVGILIGLTGCGAARFEAIHAPVAETKCAVSGGFVVCDNGISFPAPQDGSDGADGQAGVDGVDGTDGSDGSDGVDAVILSQVKVAKSSCTKVASGIWVENISSGTFFDVYSNDSCQDSKGEFCDNVEPSYGSTGQFGENKRGGAEVCWAGNIQISGERQGDDLLIRVLDFN